jgi:hypothetical protein
MTDVSTVVRGRTSRGSSPYPPFDHLDEETRAAAGRRRGEVDAYRRASWSSTFATASVDVHVVVSGRVELWDDRAARQEPLTR